MPYKFNPLTGKLDMVGMTATEKAAYLKLDQSTPQTVSNGRPVFNVGIKANNDVILKAGVKLIFDGA